MEIYTVTFCTMDQELGANPFWHTCLLLSRFDETTKKLQVVDNWGFYGLPTTATESKLRGIKISLGLDVDLSGNHGMLRHEEMRYLDYGCGLHGVTFELTKEKFEELDRKCKQMVVDQEQAIQEIVVPLHLQPKAANQTRIYPYEHLSPHIYAIEQEKAKAEHREPRLKSFALSYKDPRTCKMQAIELLDGIITPEQKQRITGMSRRTSRLSGPMEKIFLHSTGPTRQHKKRSGEVMHFRDGTDPEVKLYWTLPPQEIETHSDATRAFLKIESRFSEAIKNVIRKLQRLEWFFLNTVFEDNNCINSRNLLITRIKELYENFSIILPKKFNGTHNDWSGRLMGLFSMPRDLDEQALLKKIEDSKQLLTELYSAVVDAWDKPQDKKELEDEPEALVTYLSKESQKELCHILGQVYLEPEERMVMGR